MSIVQVVPQCPPQTCGIWDFATAVADGLTKRLALESIILSADAGRKAKGAELWRAFKWQSECAQPQSLEVSAQYDATKLLMVNYAASGYSRVCVPIYLKRLIGKYRSIGNPKIIWVVHDLLQPGPMWKRAYWLVHAQKAFLKACISPRDSVFATTAEFRQELEQVLARPIPKMPIFSVVGELNDENAIRNARSPTILFWGTPTKRKNIFKAHASWFRSAMETYSIIEVGEDAGNNYKDLNIFRTGLISHDEIRALLSTASFGILPNPIAGVEKSTVAAAYCSFGVIPIDLNVIGHIEIPGTDGIIVGKDALALDAVRRNEIREGNARYYKTRNIHCAMRVIEDAIASCARAQESAISIGDGSSRYKI